MYEITKTFYVAAIASLSLNATRAHDIQSLAINNSNAILSLSWRTTPGALCRVDVSHDLGPAGCWSYGAPFVHLGGSNSTWSTAAGTNSVAFLRVSEMPIGDPVILSDPLDTNRTAVMLHFLMPTQDAISTTIVLSDRDSNDWYDIMMRTDLWTCGSGNTARIHSVCDQTATGRYVYTILDNNGISSNFYAAFRSLCTGTWPHVSQSLSASNILALATQNLPFIETAAPTSLAIRFPKSAVTNASDIVLEGPYEIAEIDPLIPWHFEDLGTRFRIWPIHNGEVHVSCVGEDGAVILTWDDDVEWAYPTSHQYDKYHISWAVDSWWSYIFKPWGTDADLPGTARSVTKELTPGWYNVRITSHQFEPTWTPPPQGQDLWIGPVEFHVYVPPKKTVTGLLAYYPLDGNAQDASGNGNHGSLFGPTSTTGHKGTPGSALLFDGIDDYVQVDNGSAFNFSDQLTLSIWLYPSSAQSQWAVLIDKSHGYGGDGSNCYDSWVLQQVNDTSRCFYFGFGDGIAAWSNPKYYTSGTVQANNWSHLVVTKNGANIKYYINGEFITQFTADFSNIFPNGAESLFIGRWVGGERFFSGKLDDIRIYDRALSATEIQALMNE